MKGKEENCVKGRQYVSLWCLLIRGHPKKPKRGLRCLFIFRVPFFGGLLFLPKCIAIMLFAVWHWRCLRGPLDRPRLIINPQCSPNASKCIWTGFCSHGYTGHPPCKLHNWKSATCSIELQSQLFGPWRSCNIGTGIEAALFSAIFERCTQWVWASWYVFFWDEAVKHSHKCKILNALAYSYFAA